MSLPPSTKPPCTCWLLAHAEVISAFEGRQSRGRPFVLFRSQYSRFYRGGGWQMEKECRYIYWLSRKWTDQSCCKWSRSICPMKLLQIFDILSYLHYQKLPWCHFQMPVAVPYRTYQLDWVSWTRKPQVKQIGSPLEYIFDFSGISWWKTVSKEFKVLTMSITPSKSNECCDVGSWSVVYIFSTRLVFRAIPEIRETMAKSSQNLRRKWKVIFRGRFDL